MKRLGFTPEAEASLDAISEWTLMQFGPHQAKTYLTELLARCHQLAEGSANHQSCREVFAADLRDDLRFTRSGQHFVVFVETGTEVVVVDFIHSRMDLPGKIAGLGKRGAQ